MRVARSCCWRSGRSHLLFPGAVPFWAGPGVRAVETALADWLLDTPFLEWLPVRDIELQPLVPGANCCALPWAPSFPACSGIR
jgi:hypothetical protein